MRTAVNDDGTTSGESSLIDEIVREGGRRMLVNFDRVGARFECGHLVEHHQVFAA